MRRLVSKSSLLVLVLALLFFGSTLAFAYPPQLASSMTSRRNSPVVVVPALHLDLTAPQHAISPLIYGINFADKSLAATLRLPVRRNGGNSTTRYNWQLDTHNTGSDYYFENIPDSSIDPAKLPDGSTADQFVEQDRSTGSKSLLTVPLIGWTPKARPLAHPYDCGFKVSKYGAQQSTDPYDPDCGNGVHSNGSNITGNNPLDTSVAITPAFVTAWLQHLTGKYGTAANGGVALYDLDNEPMLWNSTHRDVHPQATSYDELRDRTYQYAAAVKAADAGAQTLGPVVWGWCAYFDSALDPSGCDPTTGGPDRQAHGNTQFIAWYLQQMQTYEQTNKQRILDYLDVHNYPQANGVALSSAGDANTQALRLRSTRSLWDPTYVDESWIGQPVNLIPRLHAWVKNNYPGTKLAISEYNWGGLESINGALAQADILGIFGREGLDLATLWAGPDDNQPGAFAFRMYRNYDGSGSAFGDQAVSSQSDDQSQLAIYGAVRSADSALTLMIINKTGSDLTSSTTLLGLNAATTGKVYRYSAANLTAITAGPDQPVAPTGFTASFPANSITLIVIPVAQSTPTSTATLPSSTSTSPPTGTSTAAATATRTSTATTRATSTQTATALRTPPSTATPSPTAFIPMLMLSPSTGPARTLVSASGMAFGANEVVNLFWDKPYRLLVAPTSDAQGNFTGSHAASFQIPARVASGSHTVTAVGQSTHRVAHVEFVVP